MIQYTTPTMILTVPNTLDLTLAETVYCTISQLPVVVTVSVDALTVSAHRVEVYLSQKQSGQFSPGKAEVQLNVLYDDGTRLATKTATVTIGKNLLREILPEVT